ncbi:CMP-sialic acid transporter 4-like [Carica papaya]|uniref:CMP-sialic acid transporter 4-like n=1 Tax=Carica papaya TaxID=3649 RepID=UPI000B8D0170|nr:CMP-sialic acid transporter 4-like [Carica papaya]
MGVSQFNPNLAESISLSPETGTVLTSRVTERKGRPWCEYSKRSGHVLGRYWKLHEKPTEKESAEKKKTPKQKFIGAILSQQRRNPLQLSDRVLQTSLPGWMMAIVMALLSGFAGVYTEAIIKKRPSRNINVQNFWLYIFGMAFNAVAILVQDFDAVINKGFFHGYSLITVLMIVNHALSGLAVSMVMKYADNIVKVYSTSVAMLLTAVVSVFLFGFHLSLAFFLGATVVSISVYLHSVGKLR